MKQQIHIAGAGLAGLTAAVILSRNGYAVKVSDRQKNIGGSPAYHPSIHTTPAQLDEMREYTGIDFSGCFSLCRPYPSLYDKDRLLALPSYTLHNKAYCVERGPRPSSIDSFLYGQALALGVSFAFNEKIDIAGDRGIDIAACGLHPDVYDELGIKTSFVYGYSSTRPAEQGEVTGEIIMGPFSTNYGYRAVMNGLDYNLLFSVRPIKENDLNIYKKTIAAIGMGEYPDNWQPAQFAVPDRPMFRLGNGAILAGTLAGFYDPFWGYGITGAIISGACAAREIIEPGSGITEFSRFTRGFEKKLRRRKIMDSLPYFVRGALTRLSIRRMQKRCDKDKVFASSAHEPLIWFRRK